MICIPYSFVSTMCMQLILCHELLHLLFAFDIILCTATSSLFVSNMFIKMVVGDIERTFSDSSFVSAGIKR